MAPVPAPIASPSSERALERTLFTISTTLRRMVDSPHVRELRAKARSYEPIAQRWLTVPPSSAQREATLDLVGELLGKIAELASEGGARKK
jgi:hypothetical protein